MLLRLGRRGLRGGGLVVLLVVRPEHLCRCGGVDGRGHTLG